MSEAMTKYYANKGDYEQAFKWQIKVDEKRKKYAAHDISASLLTMELHLQAQRKEIELKNQKRNKHYLAAVTIILILFVLILWKLLIINKQKKELIQSKNLYIRQEIKLLTQQINIKIGKIEELEKYGLTKRQLEIINHVRDGKTNKEIGKELFISENTVKYHLKAIYETLGVKGRHALKQEHS